MLTIFADVFFAATRTNLSSDTCNKPKLSANRHYGCGDNAEGAPRPSRSDRNNRFYERRW